MKIQDFSVRSKILSSFALIVEKKYIQSVYTNTRDTQRPSSAGDQMAVTASKTPYKDNAERTCTMTNGLLLTLPVTVIRRLRLTLRIINLFLLFLILVSEDSFL